MEVGFLVTNLAAIEQKDTLLYLRAHQLIPTRKLRYGLLA